MLWKVESALMVFCECKALVITSGPDSAAVETLFDAVWVTSASSPDLVSRTMPISRAHAQTTQVSFSSCSTRPDSLQSAGRRVASTRIELAFPLLALSPSHLLPLPSYLQCLAQSLQDLHSRLIRTQTFDLRSTGPLMTCYTVRIPRYRLR